MQVQALCDEHTPPQIEQLSPLAHGPGVQTPSVQMSARVQRDPSQLAGPFGLNWQSASQHDVALPFFEPWSHSSPGSTDSFPQRWRSARASSQSSRGKDRPLVASETSTEELLRATSSESGLRFGLSSISRAAQAAAVGAACDVPA